MPGPIGLITGTVVARSGVTCMARVLGNAGTPITRASLSTITYTVTDRSNGTVGTATSVTISSAVYDSLQTSDPRWNMVVGESALNLGADGQYGFNFLFVVPAINFPITVPDATPDPPAKVVQTPPFSYRVDFVFTPASGQQFIVPFEFTPVQTFV